MANVVNELTCHLLRIPSEFPLTAVSQNQTTIDPNAHCTYLKRFFIGTKFRYCQNTTVSFLYNSPL